MLITSLPLSTSSEPSKLPIDQLLTLVASYVSTSTSSLHPNQILVCLFFVTFIVSPQYDVELGILLFNL